MDNLGPIQEIGGTGTDSALWVSGLDPYSDSFRNWTSLAGGLTAAPAIIPNYPARPGLDPAVPIYIIMGLDHHLYYRTDNTAWQLLGGTCYDNAGAYEDASGNLTVACRGSDKVIYYATGTVSSSVISLGGFSSLGGGSNYGPAISVVAGQITFFIAGLDGQAYSRTLSGGWTGTGWQCSYHPASATARQSATTYFACNGSNGTLQYSINSGAGWSALASAGGTVVNGPALAAYSQGAVVFVEGSDQQVYKTVISASGGPLPWRLHSNGHVQYGVGASAF